MRAYDYPVHPIHGWLEALDNDGFVAVDTRDTPYAHAASALGALRRQAMRSHGLTLRTEILGPHKALVEVVR